MGARYNAARRLKRRAFFSTASLAFFSSVTVALSFIQISNAPNNTPDLDRYLALLSACMGVFLLAISLIEWGARNAERADALHRNAERLNDFQRRLGFQLSAIETAGGSTLGANRGELAQLEEYEEIRASCAENHEPIDDERFLVSHRKSKEFLVEGKPKIGSLRAFWILLYYNLCSVWYIGIFWLILVVSLWFAPWGASDSQVVARTPKLHDAGIPQIGEASAGVSQ